MPQKELSMRKVKEVLRLRFAAGLQQEQIARSCSIGQSTVHRYLKRAEEAGLSWPLPEECDDRQLNELLFPVGPGRKPKRRASVDFAEIRHQLTSHRHVTLQLLCAESRETEPDGHGSSRFFGLHHGWSRQPYMVIR